MRRFAFLIIICSIAVARAQQWTFQNIGLREGLSNGFVLDMTFDRQGYLWVATEAGLNRIVGNKVTSFRKNNSDIPSNEITTLYYDHRHDVLWLGTKQDGLSKMDGRSFRFRNFTTSDGLSTNGVTDITEATDGGVWVCYADGSLQKYDYQTDIFKTEDISIRNTIRTCLDDGKGHLYIGHATEGLTVYDLKTHVAKRFKHEVGKENSLPGNNTRVILIDHLKNVWVGTNQGMALMNPLKGTFQTKRLEYGNNIFDIVEDSEGSLWAVSDLGGISIFSPDRQEMQYITPQNSPLSSPNTRRVREDKFGNIWIGNYSTGVDFVHHRKSDFFTFNPGSNTYGLDMDNRGNLWLGGENELILCKDNKVVRRWDLTAYLYQTLSEVYCIETDRAGNVWMGINDDGVLVYKPISDSFRRIDIGDAPDVRVFYEDKDGRMWIGSELGISSYKDGIVCKEQELNKKIGFCTVYALAQDQQGQLWVGTLEHGLTVIGKDGKTVKPIDDSINQLFIDAYGGMWVATYNGLVYFRDTENLSQFTVFDERQGIADSHIRGIRQDRSGNIWVSTYSGIACLDISKQRFYNFDYHNGLPMGSFVEGSASVSSDGTIYFGSPLGVCSFNPQLIGEGVRLSDVNIVSCEGITGADLNPYRLLDIDADSTVSVGYDQNTFRIVYSISNRAQTGDVDYSYQMKGLDDKWYNNDGMDEVVFRNLQPGRYQFAVRAKLKNQDWEDGNVATLTIVVRPPFWQTWWARFIYVLLLASAIFYYFRSYKHKLMLKNRLMLAQQESLQKQELHEERLRFFTNVTHELRTPLTLIIGPLEDLVSDSRLPDVLHRKVDSIKTNADRLLNLINDILEFRKTETQNRRLTVAKGNIGKFVKEIGGRFKDLNRNPQTKVYVMANPNIPHIWFDSEIITTVVSNLMSNALKYTPEGKVNLIVNTNTDGDIDISVTDTGYGIAPDALPHVFDRYYQAKSKHQASGTGIGLALVKSLADLHEAWLTVESKEGEGSKFTFTLKSGNTYPNALHKDDTEDMHRDDTKGNADNPSEESRPLMLVVEDNSDIRQYIQESMGEDYRILQATNGLEGRDLAFQQTPDIIVSDIMMPEMDGIELTKRLKEDIRTSHIPIILLTAKTSVTDQEEGYDSGADSYLTKPFSARLLQSRVKNLLSGRRRLAELIAMKGLHNSHLATTTEENPIAEKQKQEPKLSKLDQEFMEKLNNLIESNIVVEDLDMAFMTDKMAMSHSTFYRKVKALTGMTANEYIRKMKLSHSLRLLQSGEYNVTEAATMSGFNNLGHFRESFKKEYGKSPSDFLRK